MASLSAPWVSTTMASLSAPWVGTTMATVTEIMNLTEP
jgi:hypothetical protein